MGLLFLLRRFRGLRPQVGIVQDTLENPVGPVHLRGGEDYIEQFLFAIFVGDGGEQDTLFLRQFLERLVLRGRHGKRAEVPRLPQHIGKADFAVDFLMVLCQRHHNRQQVLEK